MIPSPIRSVLTTLDAHAVPYLLMGGQACVLYGGAEFSRDLDLVLAARPDTLTELQGALTALHAERIAVPPLDWALLERGHAVHFRCHRSDVANLRLDLLTHPPRIADVAGMWARQVVMELPDGGSVRVVALPDLIETKKTQRDKDWVMIGSLIDADIVRHRATATDAQVLFWLHAARSADQLGPVPGRAGDNSVGRTTEHLTIA